MKKPLICSVKTGYQWLLLLLENKCQDSVDTLVIYCPRIELNSEQYFSNSPPRSIAQKESPKKMSIMKSTFKLLLNSPSAIPWSIICVMGIISLLESPSINELNLSICHTSIFSRGYLNISSRKSLNSTKSCFLRLKD